MAVRATVALNGHGSRRRQSLREKLTAQICDEVHLNPAYRWFCRLDLDGGVPDHSTFSKKRHGRSARGTVRDRAGVLQQGRGSRGRNFRSRRVQECYCSRSVLGGNAATSVVLARYATVHLRVCGGRRPRSHPRLVQRFVPQAVPGAPRHRQRFNPACAGNAPERFLRGGAGPVHPRVCGGRTARGLPMGANVGSSPRVRGTLWGDLARVLPPRFIPACAGDACSPTTATSSKPVHPRVCGGRLLSSFCGEGVSGSSPRVRGTRVARIFLRQERRFIPACAGDAR
jgi:Transposase domain (DUF772)